MAFAASRVSARRLFASFTRRNVLSARAQTTAATPSVFPPVGDLKVASESPPSTLPDLMLPDETATDWSKSYSGLSQQAFSKDIADVLLAPLEPNDIEIKPDGLIYLPEIKYRRVLNRAFGPGAWGLAPRSETNVGPKIVSREYALVCHGRLVAISRGEQEYFDPSGIPTATEACKSNALMRCCKDLGIASELWDPRFIREFKAKYCVEIFAEHIPTKKKKKMWRRKDQPKLSYPYQE
ncbi:mitochondrial genome maintenance MGM101-domain-containing protein [Mycena maculata]|uniref:Mitochondrial genome maintenance protein MGM101 n=1 Tax=Mycena maculata TaxID=230809 RepID=A0AAD7H6X3_9AGAR|nr:mitochondrial genome maintenance MGM101-domain-containing protein [Mycena maculata]